MAEGQDDEGAGELEDAPDGWLRDMSAQSARAQDFGRRMRWLRLRRQLSTPRARLRRAEVIDIRDKQAAKSTEVPLVPRQRD